MFDRITFDSKIMGGRACIRGMRIPVSVIVGQIAHGATRDEVLARLSRPRKRGYSAGAGVRGVVNPGGSANGVRRTTQSRPNGRIDP